MGTNLSQVFVQNGAILTATGDFNSGGAGEVGLWADGAFSVAALFQKTLSPLDTDTDGSDPAASAAVTLANPAWLRKELQIVQGGTGNAIATPVIATSAIKRLSVDVYQAWVGHKATITSANLNVANAAGTASADGDSYDFRFIIRTTPTDQLSFYDANGVSPFGDFPLGAFNTTNHKVINMSVDIADVNDADAANNLTAIKAAIAASPVLSKIVAAADVGDDIVITALHPGLIFDLIIQNVTNSAKAQSCATTGQVLGTGNDWQVMGEEFRCQSRVGNFNRMYLPQTIAPIAVKANKYHKITIEYAHNWPSSTGIAPAGELNQVVLYVGASTAIASDTTSQNITVPFGITNDATVLESAKYVW